MQADVADLEIVFYLIVHYQLSGRQRGFAHTLEFFGAAFAASDQREHHQGSQGQCQNLFHDLLLRFFIF